MKKLVLAALLSIPTISSAHPSSQCITYNPAKKSKEASLIRTALGMYLEMLLFKHAKKSIYPKLFEREAWAFRAGLKSSAVDLSVSLRIVDKSPLSNLKQKNNWVLWTEMGATALAACIGFKLIQNGLHSLDKIAQIEQ